MEKLHRVDQRLQNAERQRDTDESPSERKLQPCRDLADAAQTIVFVEQNLAATLMLASRVYIINNGHIAHEGSAQEIRARPEILHRHLGV